MVPPTHPPTQPPAQIRAASAPQACWRSIFLTKTVKTVKTNNMLFFLRFERSGLGSAACRHGLSASRLKMLINKELLLLQLLFHFKMLRFQFPFQLLFFFCSLFFPFFRFCFPKARRSHASEVTLSSPRVLGQVGSLFGIITGNVRSLFFNEAFSSHDFSFFFKAKEKDEGKVLN